jgi:Uma2 family endonuclease
MAAKTLMTVQEFAQMKTAETEDYELVEGELIPLSTGTPRHSEIRGRVEAMLWFYFRQNPIGKTLAETDCVVEGGTVRRPDVSVFLLNNLKRLDMDVVPIPFAPDIAVEVLSPSEAAMDVNRKIREYLMAGAAEVWVLDHFNHEMFIHTASGIRVLGEGETLQSQLLPGFAAQVQDLVAD